MAIVENKYGVADDCKNKTRRQPRQIKQMLRLGG